MRSITHDQGAEMADQARFAVGTNIPVFFRDSRSPWQRGSNENTNGLLRQHLQKGTNLSGPHKPDWIPSSTGWTAVHGRRWTG